MKSGIHTTLLLMLCLVLCNCRGLSAVERHFLRMPAEATGGLSTVERSQWLREAVKANPGIRRTARKEDFLALPGYSGRVSLPLNGMDVLHRSGGALAIVVKDGVTHPAGQKLTLLQLAGNRYKNITRQTPGTKDGDVWQVQGAGAGSITGYRVAGRSGKRLSLRPSVRLTWDGHHWHSARAAGPLTGYLLP